MNIEFIKSAEIPNKFNEGGAPLLALYYSLGKKEVEWSFGSSKAKKFLKVLGDNWDDYLAHKDELWKVDVDFGIEGAKPFEMNRTRIQVLNHFKSDVEAYIKKYYVPAVAISEPRIEIIENKVTGDYVPTLLLPCYEKKPEDEGEGKIPRKFTQKDCKYLFDADATGITMKDIRAHVKGDNKDKPLSKKVTSRDGRELTFTLSPEEIACILEYKNVLSNFERDTSEINYD